MASVLATVSQRRWKTRMTCLFEVTDREARQLSERLFLCAGTSRVVRGGLPGGDVRLRFLDWCELIRGIVERLSICGASRRYARWLVFGTVAAGSTHSDSARALDAGWDWARRRRSGPRAWGSVGTRRAPRRCLDRIRRSGQRAGRAEPVGASLTLVCPWRRVWRAPLFGSSRRDGKWECFQSGFAGRSFASACLAFAARNG